LALLPNEPGVSAQRKTISEDRHLPSNRGRMPRRLDAAPMKRSPRMGMNGRQIASDSIGLAAHIVSAYHARTAGRPSFAIPT